MDVKEAIKKLEKSEEFKQWHKGNEDNFLSYAFTQAKDKEIEWQLGYYNKKNDKVTTFILGEKITLMPGQEVFKRPEDKIIRLNLENVKLAFIEIIEKVEKFQKEKYPNEIINQKVVILQNLKDYGDIWNITLISKAFNMINIKVNASNGEILKHNLSSILDLKKKD